MENSKNFFSPILQLFKYDNRNILEETVLTICNNTSFDPIHHHNDLLISQNSGGERLINAQNQNLRQVRTYPQYQNSRPQRVSMAQQNSQINPQSYGINTGSAMQAVQIKGSNNMVLREEIKGRKIMGTQLNRGPSFSHLNTSTPVRNNNFRQHSVNNQPPQLLRTAPYQYHCFQPANQKFVQNIDMNPNILKQQQRNNIHQVIPSNTNNMQFVRMERRLSQVPRNEDPIRLNYQNQGQVNSRSYSIPQKMLWKDDPNSTNSTNIVPGMYRTERYVGQSTNGTINQQPNHSNTNSSKMLGIINQVEQMNYNGSARNRYYHGPGLGLGK